MSRKTVSGLMLTLLLVSMLTLALNVQTVLGKQGFNTIIKGESTLVSGYIPENTTWTLEGSPYIVVGDVVVETDVFLEIEAGVTVKFTNATSLIIDGVLIAKGNKSHRITFTSNITTPAPGDWETIQIRSASLHHVIQFINVKYAITGMRIEKNVQLSVSDSTFSFCSSYGLYAYYSKGFTLSNVNITNNKRGIYFYSAFSGHFFHFDKCLISNNTGYGVSSAALFSTVVFTYCQVVNNSGNGVEAYTDGWYGGTVEIRHSSISTNLQNGILSDSGTIQHCNIVDNGGHSVESREGDINATYNWWGTANETLIQESIYDYYDDYTVGKVFYKPYLLAPIPEATILDFSLTPNPAYVGEEVALSGRLADLQRDPIDNATIELSYSTDGGGNWTSVGSVITNMSGHFGGKGTISSAGTYLVEAFYNGSETYGPSSHTETLTVLNKTETQIFLELSPNPASPGQIVTLKGVLLDQFSQPLSNETVELYARPLTGSWSYITSLTTNSYGIFTWQATIPEVPTGTYVFAVYYPGSERYESSYNFDVLVIQ